MTELINNELQPDSLEIRTQEMNELREPLPIPRISPSERRFQDIDGFMKRVEEVPSQTPRNLYEQFVLVTNGSSSRVYIYEPIAQAWRYTQLS
jgi:hypothetical protein